MMAENLLQYTWREFFLTSGTGKQLGPVVCPSRLFPAFGFLISAFG
jgi:hypothetical protein